MPRVIHFELHASKPGRAIAFYSGVFGWTFHKWDGPIEYWTITTGSPDEPGINGGMIERVGRYPVRGQAVNAFVCTIQVESLDETIEQATQAGAELAVPRFELPGIGWMAYLRDPEGNTLGLIEKRPLS